MHLVLLLVLVPKRLRFLPVPTLMHLVLIIPTLMHLILVLVPKRQKFITVPKMHCVQIIPKMRPVQIVPKICHIPPPKD